MDPRGKYPFRFGDEPVCDAARRLQNQLTAAGYCQFGGSSGYYWHKGKRTSSAPVSDKATKQITIAVAAAFAALSSFAWLARCNSVRRLTCCRAPRGR